jgi:acetoin utilization deacetylase AcuC-like enzyme
MPRAILKSLSTIFIMNNKFGLLLDNRYFNHVIERHSAENPERIRHLYATVREEYQDRICSFAPRAASIEDIQAVHSSFYLQQIREYSVHSDPYLYDRDTYLMEDSLDTALLAAGGCLEMADAVMNKTIDQGFALIRPPGHHAEPGRGMGFCILNNIGITAKYLRNKYQINRILILDFDVHHGNGTQEVFYDSNEVLFISLHQRGIFPYSGAADEIGKDLGAGYTINVPVYPQFGDSEYTYLVGRLLQAVMEQYLPQIILVSAGFDGHKDDSISAVLLSTEWYGNITTMLRQYARDVCENRLIFILEGGYNPVSLECSVLSTLNSFLKPETSRIGVMYSERADKLLRNHPLKSYWTM